MNMGRILALSLIALLAACDRDKGSTPATAPVATSSKVVDTQRGPTAKEQTVGMVEAVTVGKSTAPVAVKFDVKARPTVGQPLEVVLAIMPQVAADPVVLTLTDSPGLQLAAGNPSNDIAAAQPDQVYRQTVTLTPTAEGVHLLGFTVSLKHDEITESRTFSVPIIVGAGGDGGTIAKH
jgi:hypothetical protein